MMSKTRLLLLLIAILLLAYGCGPAAPGNEGSPASGEEPPQFQGYTAEDIAAAQEAAAEYLRAVKAEDLAGLMRFHPPIPEGMEAKARENMAALLDLYHSGTFDLERFIVTDEVQHEGQALVVVIQGVADGEPFTYGLWMNYRENRWTIMDTLWERAQ